MEKTGHPDYPYELEKFNSILSHLRQYLGVSIRKKAIIDIDLDYSIKHYNPDNVEQFHELTLNLLTQSYLEQKIRSMEMALKKPYFARIDFTADDIMKKESFYIGKMTLFKQDDNELLITDWRAPVASLYYEERIGRSSYVCEDGKIEGDLTLKRQYEIENGEFNGLMDVDITTNDDFLQAALGASKDKRLKDIVATIQAEQNRIIRTNMFTNLVVQGAAGSGKTTIALHRIAYLLYNYEKKIKPQNIIIIAPNHFFLSYISDVLPDLGVENIRQTTFEDFVYEYTGEKIKIKTSAETLAESIEKNHFDDNAIKASHLKSSLRYKDMIEKYVKAVIPKILPDKDFEIEGFVLMEIREIKIAFLREYSFMPISRRIEKLQSVMEVKLQNKKDFIIKHIENKYEMEKINIKRKMPDSEERRQIIIDLLDERDKKLKSIKKIFRTAIKDYIASFKFFSPLKYYQFLFERPSLVASLAKDIFTDEETKILISQKEFTTDDLAPLLYIHYRMHGKTEDEPVKLVVIDEAQDVSQFQLWAMQAVCKDAYFNIYGDLNQGIYSHRGITDWKDALSIYGKRNPAYATLSQSYRTTVEIMDSANTVIEKLDNGLPKACPVIRHGPNVSVTEVNSTKQAAAEINKKIKSMNKMGYRSFAIICKTLSECKALKKELNGEISIITGKEQDYIGGVMLIPSYLVKGLEFDVCCIANASSESFTEAGLDIKLLYIAMTRALHELIIYSVGTKTPMLDNTIPSIH